jgi:hypothetical protein
MPGAGLDDVKEYTAQPWPSKMRMALETSFVEIPFERLQPASVIWFWITRKRLPQHLALWTGRGTIIHAWAEAHRVCESSFDPYWQERVSSCWDYK